ncbi:MAG TPA: ChbG/HpnK family deacetylase [Terriglobia bacterium]|nr:ChbG/HpnK family deacetylase [Terriglobia bacterium]
MKKLIVNADDFGLAEGVNRAIIEGHKKGIITSTTLMANGRAFNSAVAAALTAPELGIGVHLNLTQGPPVSRASSVPSIVTSEGIFYRSPARVARQFLTHKVKPSDIESEFRSQIEKVASAGIKITHLDGHKHIHLLPPIFTIVVKLARDYGIKCVRCPVEPALSALGPLRSGRRGWPRAAKQYLLGRALSTLVACQASKVQDAGLYSSDRFYGLSQTGFLDAALLEQILRTLPEGTSEIMCHPGYVDEALLGTSTRLLGERETELEVLTSADVRQLVTELGIELISYDSLVVSGEPATRKSNEHVQEIPGKG